MKYNWWRTAAIVIQGSILGLMGYIAAMHELHWWGYVSTASSAAFLAVALMSPAGSSSEGAP